jgi:hypothetical protein
MARATYLLALHDLPCNRPAQIKRSACRSASQSFQSMLRMETDMSTYTDVIDRYFAIWNETEPARRRSLIAKTWTESANYLDP